MKDKNKPKEQLISELAELRQRIAELEASETKRKRVEETLWESEKHYRFLAENAADVIWTVDMNMHPTYISPSITRLLGYSVEEAMAMAMEEVFTPASFEVTMKALAEELAIEKMEQKDIFRSRVMELELKRKDGSIVPVEISYSFFRGADLQPIAVLAIARDITERKQAEEQRNKFFDLSLHLLLIAGLDGYIKRINPGWTEVLGHTVEELIGTSFFELVHPDDRAATLAEMDKLSTGIITLYFENRYRCKDGSYRLLAWAAVPHPETELVYAIAQDITERRQAEAAMQESERKYRELADFLPQIVFETDERGNLTFSNRYGFQSFGYTLEDFDKGLNALQVLIPEERDRASENIQRVLNGKEFSGIEYMALRKDGSTFPVIIYSTPIIHKNKPVGLRGIIVDITERKQAEEKIKRAAEEWRTTFDSITDLVSIQDKDFRLVRVNRAFADTFKMKPKELIGKLCYEIVHGTNEPVPSCPHMKTLETKEPAMGDFFEPHLGMHLEVSTSPIFNEKGEVIASVHVARDITGRKKMEEQLIVTDRLASIGELASGIAHELNNPLTSVIGFSDLLLGKEDLPDDVKEDLRVINREAQRAAGVVRNLLAFARKQPPAKQAVDINNTIQTVLELRAYEQKVSNIEVITRFAPDLPETTADGFQLQQVFLNIIINAEHFMTEAHGRGTLTITTERIGDIIRASFADDGPGIAKENLGHVFDPFFTTREVGKGTGLGLSISYGIITEHGGRVYAESELGKGATFAVELPINK